MSGIVSGMDYSLLFTGATTSAGSAYTDMLTTIEGGGSSTGTGVSSTDPLTALTMAEQNQTADVAKEAKTPTVARAIAAFTQGIANAKTIQQALQNPYVLQVLLTANNLGDQTGYPALARKALMSNPNDANSLANQLSSTNSNWLSAAKTYNFYKNGLAELQNPKIQATLTNAYAEISWMNSLDKTTPGLSMALQFRQMASSLTSVDQILGNNVSWQVVLNALGIPQQIAFQDTTAQEQAVSSRMNVKDLQDPTFVTRLTDQYLLAMQQQNQSSSTSAPSMDALAEQAMGLVV
jgi:hypothetical protein